ncbi:hypothetical protein BGZ73_002261 [Actinomortierella ambigua]|nr:hypothetical protein BGZ73_002261 [Actinomortierella ambigua]
MSVSTELQAAVDKYESFSRQPKDTERLELYGLYKQAALGDNDTKKPSMFDIVAKYKWEAWMSRKGMAQDEAERLFIALVDKLALIYA